MTSREIAALNKMLKMGTIMSPETIARVFDAAERMALELEAEPRLVQITSIASTNDREPIQEIVLFDSADVPGCP